MKAKPIKPPRPLDLTTPQSRHLSQHRRLLVVEAVDEQPNFGSTARPKPWCVNGHWQWRRCNPWTTFTCPYQPGDIVPCRERWADVNTEGGPAFMYSDGTLHFCGDDAYPVEYDRYPGCKFSMWFSDLLYAKQRKCTDDHKWRSVASMPEYLIRYCPVVESVECRRVVTIMRRECAEAGFLDQEKRGSDARLVTIWGANEFKSDWHRRYRRRGDAYSFDRAWGFFYTLVLKGE